MDFVVSSIEDRYSLLFVVLLDLAYDSLPYLLQCTHFWDFRQLLEVFRKLLEGFLEFGD
jgi:hypothetical protein